MRLLALVVLVISGVSLSACPTQSVESGVSNSPIEAAPPVRQPVLVELFTSEGCSSCPPADRNLAFLEKQQPVQKADVITLAFHVDYWDRLGWKDRFSSALFTERQQGYSQAMKLDSVYTPQMVVDGHAEFVGSDSGRASEEILKAAAYVKAPIEIRIDGAKVTVKVRGVQQHNDSTVYAALAEDGISSRVERGENSGMTLEHVSVVRELKTVGVLAAGAAELDSTLEFQPPADAKTENLKVVVFVQENDGRKVIGVARRGFGR
jgi:hypothetical protein